MKTGRVEEITSTANPRIKWVRGLSAKKNREREGLFLAEGLKLATDALAAGWAIRTLIHAKTAMDEPTIGDRIGMLAATVHARGGDVLVVPEKLLTTITRRDNPQAVVAVIEQKMAPLGDPPKASETWLALDRVRDPGNLGTCLRTADALGVSRVLLVGETTDPFALDAVRATMGSFFHMPLTALAALQFTDWATRWRGAGGQVTGTHLAGSVDHRTIDFASGPQLILMGNEQQGLTDDLAGACDRLARIPMSGQADSLNLAVATGIMLFAARSHALEAA